MIVLPDYMYSAKRVFDCALAIIILVIFTIPMLFIAVIIKVSSRGSILYWSDRVGINNVIFKMPKFRTMIIDAPVLATHLLENPDQYVTCIGRLLRQTSLDELPQCYSVLKGDMSFVGPRPALYNQHDLIEQRTQKGVHKLLPGLTGWAQINGRDELTIPDKVSYDEYYLQHTSLWFDAKIMVSTLVKALKREGVSH